MLSNVSNSNELRPVRQPARTAVVCHVVHTLHVGGAEVLAKEFAERMSDRYRVVFACLDACGSLGHRLRDAGYNVEVLQRRPGLDLRCAKHLLQYWRQQKVDLVHAHQYAPFFYSALGRFARRRPPILFTEHGRDYPDFPRRKRMLANRFLLHREDQVVAVGEHVRQALIKNEGLPSHCVQVIYNGVNLSRYGAERPDRTAVRRELGIAEHEWVIMQVARLNRLKDHATGLHALRRIAAACPQVRLVLVGDGEERQSIEQLIGSLHLESHVRLLGTRSDVPRLLQAADTFLLTSITEGIALTLIEAIASGLPCVATRVGGNPEVLGENECGLLAEAGDAEGLAVALQTIHDDKDLAGRFAEAGPARAAALFDGESMHESYARLYEQMLNVAQRDLTARESH